MVERPYFTHDYYDEIRFQQHGNKGEGGSDEDTVDPGGMGAVNIATAGDVDVLTINRAMELEGIVLVNGPGRGWVIGNE